MEIELVYFSQNLYVLYIYISDVFISCLDSFWRHPFTAENPLVGNFSKYVLWRNKLIYILDNLRVGKILVHFYFWDEL